MILYANSETGSKVGPGTSRRPLRSLQSAIARAEPGDTIEARGVFAGQVIHRPGVSLVGDDATIRAPGQQHGILIFASGVSISGFTVEQAGAGIAAARGAYFITLRGNTVRDNRGNGISLIGGSGYVVQDNRVLNNIGTRDRHSSGISILNPRDCPMSAAYQIRVFGNTIIGNGTLAGTDGFGCIADKWAAHTPTPFAGWALFADNLISGNWSSGFYAYHARNIVLRGNVFSGNGTDPRFKRAAAIGLNNTQHVRILRNTADSPTLVLAGNTAAVELANNRFAA